jgi:hypothetical protein
MNLLRKLPPGRLSRAIVALSGRGGNKRMGRTQPGPNEADETLTAAGGSRAKLSKRTTITVETESLLVVSTERRSSRVHAEVNDKHFAHPEREPSQIFSRAITPTQIKEEQKEHETLISNRNREDV